MTTGVRMGAFAVFLALTGAPETLSGGDRPDLLAKLHDGRFDAARKSLRAGGPLSSPEDLFFDAFTTYWLLVFDDDNERLKTEFEGQLGSVIAAAENNPDPSPDGNSALWAGSAHLLLAELRASQKHPFGAAFEAKKAKRALEAASGAGSDTTDALFGLGTFNYVADIVPSYVKGLRALLFLPKGDRELGIRQLETAASTSRFFRLEARLFLVTIYSSKHERKYAQAMEQRDRLLSSFPESIAPCYVSAHLDISLGRYEQALAQLDRADARARALGDVDPVVLRNFEQLRAKAEMASLRFDRAEATASKALASGAGLGPSIKEDFENVQKAARRHLSEAALPALLAADASLREGKAEEALEALARANAAGLPDDLQAPVLFRRAQAEDLLGHRDAAVDLYKRVTGLPGFPSKDGAYFYMQAPYRPSH